MSNLNGYLEKYVHELVAASPREISAAEMERLRIYTLLLASMVAYQWCGNKPRLDDSLKPSLEPGAYGPNPIAAKYPDQQVPKERGIHLKRDYLGHNIASFAVDRDGCIIDFDFNHNEIFNSSVQHAEARLLNRVFALNQINDSWNAGPVASDDGGYSRLLSGVTVFTSLESCAQCSGIMTLGNVNEVVYLQEDPGQHKIGNILYRLTETNQAGAKTLAPRPIPASLLGISQGLELAEKYSTSGLKSLTSFLCTDTAYRIFLTAEEQFASLTLAHPDWKSPLPGSPGKFAKLSNSEVLQECFHFYAYFTKKGRRGSPH